MFNQVDMVVATNDKRKQTSNSVVIPFYYALRYSTLWLSHILCTIKLHKLSKLCNYMYSISLEGYVVWLFHIGVLISVFVGLVYYGSVST